MMTRWLLLLLWIAIPVAFALADDHLSEFLRVAGDGGPEERVRRLRDAFGGRVRCGVGQGSIAEKLCRDCLSAERIHNMTRDPEDSGGSRIMELGQASVVFLNYFLSFQTSCTEESVRRGYVGSCQTYDRCRAELHAYLGPAWNALPTAPNLEALEKILREVKAILEPEPSRPCFSAESLLEELDAESERLHALPRDVATALLLTSHLYSGECIDVGESVADFLDDLFLHYGDGCERVMTQSGFGELWNDLQMQRRVRKHIDHGVQKNACSSTGHGKDGRPSTSVPVTIPARDGPPNNRQHLPPSRTSLRTPKGAENSDTLVVLIPSSDVSEKSANDPEPPYVVADEGEATANASSSRRRRVRHTATSSEDHDHKNLANECLPSNDLLQRFLTPGNQVITSSEFLQVCPALVQQAVSGVCNARLKATALLDPPKRNQTRDIMLQATSQGANPWFAVASVSLITAVSLLGLFLLPVLKKSFFVHINAFFTGLAFGTMSGDVVLHLMPQYLGLHGHEESAHEHDSESALDRLFPSYLQRQLAFLLTVYLLLLMECICAAFMGRQEQRQQHGHSHGSVDICLRDVTAAGGDVENGEIKSMSSRCSKIVEFLKPSNLFTGISSKAAVIILADTVHNFADGMAIAVGFSTSYKDGFSTSVAVFFHELPHEIGDFAVLMNCGLGYWRAFVFNVLSGLSAFLGLGVGVVTAGLFREWLLCITAGLFFFVVMAEMLPDMRLESREKWQEFLVKIVGTVFGILTMVCIAVYELSSSDV